MACIRILVFHLFLMNIIFQYNFSNYILGSIISNENKNGDYVKLSSIEEKGANEEITKCPIRKTMEKFFKRDIKFANNELIRTKRALAIKGREWPYALVNYNDARELANADIVTKTNLSDAMYIFQWATCMQFNHFDYIQSTLPFIKMTAKPEGCWVKPYGASYTEYTIVNLQKFSKCTEVPVIVHNLLHAIGFAHEHQRPDRDGYITVNTENVRKGQRYKFKPYMEAEVENFSLPYDFWSSMHYESYRYAIDPQVPVIQSKISGRTIFPSLGLSPYDVAGVRRMFHCGPGKYCPPCDPLCYKPVDEEDKSKFHYAPEEMENLQHMTYHVEQLMNEYESQQLS